VSSRDKGSATESERAVAPHRIQDPRELEAALAEPLAVLYKHSPLCGLSDTALRQVRSFMEDNPDVPVYLVDVIRARSISREVEHRLSVRHESPQAFVLRCGTVAWHGSHRAVTAEALGREVEPGA
jgi:bacillithiol system protein YtxJ